MFWPRFCVTNTNFAQTKSPKTNRGINATKRPFRLINGTPSTDRGLNFKTVFMRIAYAENSFSAFNGSSMVPFGINRQKETLFEIVRKQFVKLVTV